MRSPRTLTFHYFRLVLELVVCVMSMEVLVMYALSAFVPGIDGMAAAFLDSLLLALLVLPLIVWRIHRAEARSSEVKAIDSSGMWQMAPVAVGVFIFGILATNAFVSFLNERSLETSHLRFSQVCTRIRLDFEHRLNQLLFSLTQVSGVVGSGEKPSVERIVENLKSLRMDFKEVVDAGFVHHSSDHVSIEGENPMRSDNDVSGFTSRASIPRRGYWTSIVQATLGSNEVTGSRMELSPELILAVEQVRRTGTPSASETGKSFMRQPSRGVFAILIPISTIQKTELEHQMFSANEPQILLVLVSLESLIDSSTKDSEKSIELVVHTNQAPIRSNHKVSGTDSDYRNRAQENSEQRRFFSHEEQIQMAGILWRLSFSAFGSADTDVYRERTSWVLGVLATTFLSLLIFIQGKARANALSLARTIKKELENSESEMAMLSTIASRAGSAVIVSDKNGRIEWVNDSFVKLTGYTIEEVRGRTPGSILQGPDTDPHTVEIMRRGVSTGEGFYAEVVNYSKSRERYWLSVDVRPFLDKKGNMSGFIGVGNDITKRKVAENLLAENTARMNSIIQHAPCVFFQIVVSIEGARSLSFLSSGYSHMFGGSVNAALQDPSEIFARLHNSDRQRVLRYLERTLLKSCVWRDCFRVTTESKEVIWVNGSATVTREKDGRYVWFGVLTDITELQRAKEAATVLNQELEVAIEQAVAASGEAIRANQAKSHFLATMSHEIRTPMNGVIGMTSLLLETSLSVQQREFTEIIRGSGEHLLGLINDILDFSKIESGKVELESETFCLRECIEETLDLLGPRAASKGLDLIYEIGPETPNYFRGDISRIRQILVNLVGNSLKFTEHGEVEVNASCTRNGQNKVDLHFSVKDSGIGIPKDAQTRLFTAFSQVDSSTTRRFGGTGLGLSICRRLADLMGGRIWVESEIGKGSTFHFNVQVEESLFAPNGLRMCPMPALIGKNVLIIDDNDSCLRILCNLVTKWGMIPTPVNSLDDARCSFDSETRFDAVLFDGIVNESTCMTILNRYIGPVVDERIPIVEMRTLPSVLSNNDRRSLRFVTKPIKPVLLYDTLMRVLGEPSNSRAPLEISREGHGDSSQRAERILVAEDNIVNQKVAVHLLLRLGYRADVAANGLEVLEAIRRQKYDIIFMDVQMPEMDGLEAAQRIVEIEPDPSKRPWIVALTANAMTGDRERCLASGMDDYLSKPVNSSAITAAIARACAQTEVQDFPMRH